MEKYRSGRGKGEYLPVKAFKFSMRNLALPGSEPNIRKRISKVVSLREIKGNPVNNTLLSTHTLVKIIPKPKNFLSEIERNKEKLPRAQSCCPLSKARVNKSLDFNIKTCNNILNLYSLSTLFQGKLQKKSEKLANNHLKDDFIHVLKAEPESNYEEPPTIRPKTKLQAWIPQPFIYTNINSN